ncbi:hypothetical protein [Nocardioides bruguierae]|uniref:Uncharacterized protein n=1 Tax=Nocardioides bruguierae TaxID=2945102 RepID=A0A9X2D423_9ACTN|nr:hypothetical protein [Nocardioides bruguierae]MCM0618781.1 hypothetical protein [Nocardioides bruguierae]
MNEQDPEYDEDDAQIDQEMALCAAAITALHKQDHDALAEVANLVAEEMDPGHIVTTMASLALLLHRSPDMGPESLTFMLNAQASGAYLGEGEKDGFLGEEFLDLLEDSMAAQLRDHPDGGEDDLFSEQGEQLLALYDRRPGSSVIVRMGVVAASTMLINLLLEMYTPGLQKRRSPEAATKYALLAARAALRREPIPNVFSAEWDDLDPEAPDA